jgi:DASH complex subunit DAM1
LRASQSTPTDGNAAGSHDHPLNAIEHAFSELSDGMADLEANFMHLSLLHESLGRFNENFGGFLYGLNMSAFCVDFPEAPIPQSFARQREGAYSGGEQSSMFQSHTGGSGVPDTEATFLTTDTSFVDNPPPTVKASKYSSVPGSSATPRARGARGGPAGASGRGRGAIGGAGANAGGSGIGRGGPSGRGGAANTGSRIGRGIPRGRGVR